jgi:hypothetical protein
MLSAEDRARVRSCLLGGALGDAWGGGMAVPERIAERTRVWFDARPVAAHPSVG